VTRHGDDDDDDDKHGHGYCYSITLGISFVSMIGIVLIFALACSVYGLLHK
jgi:hypothetical protein